MVSKFDKPKDLHLRKKAENLLKKDGLKKHSQHSESEALKLIHELEVHQIELELQNNELQNAKAVADIATDKYSSLYDFAPSGYFTLSKLGNISELNLTSALMIGKERTKLINSRFSLFVSTDTLSVFNLFLEKVFENKSQESCEVCLLNDADLPEYVLLSGIVAENEELCNITMVSITQRKVVEQELVSAKEKVELVNANITSIIEGNTNSIWAFNSNYEILYLNKVFEQEFYQSFGVLLEVGGSLVESIPETIRHFWKARYDRVLANEQYTVEDAIDTENGKVYIQVSFNPIVKNGEVVGGSCFGSNITSRKLEEIELIKTKEQAQESDRLKSAFLANMSHEIRTPMNGILGFAGLLKKPELSGKQQQKYINIIEKSGARMLNIINDIVDISKIEAGLMEVTLKESNINEQTEYIYTFFKPEVEAKGMTLSCKNTLSNKEALVTTDREKVFAVLTNLIKNAIKYSKKGSIEFGYKKRGGFLEFFVKDTGIGIAVDRQKAVFKRFIQADIDDKMAHEGAGLGLAISKAYIEMLNGKIWVDSMEGEGSVFYFTIPYNKISLTEIAKNNLSKTGVESLNLKTLIVEDDETSQMLLEINVEEFSSEPLKARTGIEAIKTCHLNPDIDLILMDVRMPGMGGYEATKKIRKFNKEVVIIAQTAYGLSGDREKALEAGCNDYISKPIDKDKLLALIQKHFK